MLTYLADVLAPVYRGVPGVRLEVVSGWERRGKSGISPKVGVQHHTGGGDYDPLLNYMARSSSIAPLCNIASSRDGARVTIVAAGKSNNAGAGGWAPKGATSNYHTIGWEAQHSGGPNEQWTGRHVENLVIGWTALFRYLKWDSSHLVSHKEWAPTRKVDPAGGERTGRPWPGMDPFRTLIQQRLKGTTAKGEFVASIVFYAHASTVDLMFALAGMTAQVANCAVVCDAGVAEKALRQGAKVYAIGGKAADALPKAIAIRGRNRKETLDKVNRLVQTL